MNKRISVKMNKWRKKEMKKMNKWRDDQVPNKPRNILIKISNLEFLLLLLANYLLNPKSNQKDSYYIMYTLINGQLPI